MKKKTKEAVKQIIMGLALSSMFAVMFAYAMMK